MKTNKDKKTIDIDNIKKGVKDELKEFEKNNQKAFDGFNQKERILILYYMIIEQSTDIKGLKKTTTILYWLFVFVNLELLLLTLFVR